MTPLDLVPRWSGSTIRVVVGAVPATLAIAGATVICLLALFMPERHQQYALRIQAGIIRLARVLVGAPAPAVDEARDDEDGFRDHRERSAAQVGLEDQGGGASG